MAVNGESEAGVARDGDKAEPVAVTAHKKFRIQRARFKLTVCREQHSLRQEGHSDHQDSDPYH
jgi:hypothetical protein